MKYYSTLVISPLLAAAVDEGPIQLPHILGRELASKSSFHRNNEERELQIDCSYIKLVVESQLSQVYGVGFDCTCSSTSLSCRSRSETCCGETCMTIRDTAYFDSSGMVDLETVCQTFTGDSVLGEPLLAGQTRCAEAQFCGSSICSCDATLGNMPCSECSVCSNMPFDPSGILQFMATDCSNIAGGDAISFECEDFDTMEEVMEWAFTNCSGAASIGVWGIAALVVFSLYFGF